jgi:hypothetical protein
MFMKFAWELYHEAVKGILRFFRWKLKHALHEDEIELKIPAYNFCLIDLIINR